MSGTSFSALIGQLIKVFIFICVGFVGGKCGILDDTGNERLSRVYLKIGLPCMIVASSLKTDVTLKVSQMLAAFLAAALWQVVLIAVSLLLARCFCRQRRERGAFAFMLAFGNLGIFGFPLIQPLFGSLGLLYGALMNIVFNFLCFTLGISFISGEQIQARQIYSRFSDPVIIASVIAMVRYTVAFPCPAAVQEAVGALGDTALPLLMLTIGCSLAGQKQIRFAQYPKALLTVGIRLIGMPVIIALLTLRLPISPVMRSVMILMAGMPIAGNATSLNILYGAYEKQSSCAVFLSTFLSLFTIPLVAALMIS